MATAEPEGGKATTVDTDYVLGCRGCGRLLDALHRPTCPVAYGAGRHFKEEGRKVCPDDCMKWRAEVKPGPVRRSKR